MTAPKDRLVTRLEEKDYSFEVFDRQYDGGSKVTWKVDPRRHPEWRDMHLEVQDPFFGSGRISFGDESTCSVSFDKQGKVHYIEYQPSPKYGFGGFLPEIEREVRKVEQLLEIKLLEE